MPVKTTNEPNTRPLPPEPDFSLLGYLHAHSGSDTYRMQARSHWRWHRGNPDRICENPDFPQMQAEMGFWERLRA